MKRLYVWDGVLEDYTAGIMFALADSAAEAREVLCPGWNAAEDALNSPGFCGNPERPLGPQPGVNNGHGYCAGSIVHTDLRGEPDVYDPAECAAVGFTIWGGG